MKMVEISGQERFWEINAQESTVQKRSIFLKSVTGHIYSQNRPSVWYEAPSGRIKMKDRFFYLYQGFLKTIPPHSAWKLTAQNIFLLPSSGKIQADGNPRLESKEIIATSTLIFTKSSFNDFIMQKNAQIVQFSTLEQETATLNANEISFLRKDGVFSATENIKFLSSTFEAYSQYATWNRNQNILMLYKQVKLNGPEKSIILTERALIDEINQLVTLNGQVDFKQDDIWVRSDTALWKRRENIIEFYGKIKAYQKNREFLGEQIYVDIKAKQLLSVGRSKIILDK
jgi:lipopolysaccharide assembly outer membrane protein LptD (OstA)